MATGASGIGRRGVLAAALAMPGLARAEGEWPARPIRMVVAWPPGGGADIPARIVSAPMQQALGQAIVIENRGGASGAIGAGAAAQAAPDGYTVLADTSSVVTNSLLQPNLGYDSATALAPVIQVIISPLMLVVRPDDPARTLAELLGRMRAAPGRIAYASSGIAAGTHLSSALLLRRAGVQGTHVAYRGGAQSVAGILGGDASFTFSTLPQATPLVQEGRLRALAVSTAERLAALPDVPTVAEQGFPGYELNEWLGFFVPMGTPAPVIARLQAATDLALREPEVLRRLGQIGMLPAGGSTAAFAAFLADQRTRMAGLIKEEGIKVE
jgi:tripartite-type tricarboxylate transporter receptor subunit TctC